MSRMVLMALLAVLALLPLRAELLVGTTTETVRVLRGTPPLPFSAVQVSAARNEWVSFQILLRSDKPVYGLTLEPVDLRGPKDEVIPAGSAQLYREHQLEVTTPSYRNANFTAGWYPDALIPFRHPLNGDPLQGPRFQAVPFDLPANETHGFFVDIYVPPTAKAGPYAGNYVVRNMSGVKVNVRVTVHVWDFTLPDTPALRTAFGSPQAVLRNYYKQRADQGKEAQPTDWAAVDAQCIALLSQHHINATPTFYFVPREQADHSWLVPEADIAKFRDFVDKYHINAYQVVNPKYYFPDPEADRDKLVAWMKALDKGITELNRPQVTFYIYLYDEPNTKEEYALVQKWGPILHEAKTAVKVLVVEQPQTQDAAWGDLYGAVDIWCPLFSIYVQTPAEARQALGETIWTYTALAQRNPTPWWLLDNPLLNYRVPAWMAWRYRIRGLLYWGGMCYWAGVEDPWTDPKTLDRRTSNPALLYNGEGSLLYPGRPVGYDGIAPSMRLKALRDAIEDYEYLSILERAGKAEAAQQVVLPLAGSFFTWEPNPAAYETARETLAKMIIAVQKPRR